MAGVHCHILFLEISESGGVYRWLFRSVESLQSVDIAHLGCFLQEGFCVFFQVSIPSQKSKVHVAIGIPSTGSLLVTLYRLIHTRPRWHIPLLIEYPHIHKRLEIPLRCRLLIKHKRRLRIPLTAIPTKIKIPQLINRRRIPILSCSLNIPKRRLVVFGHSDTLLTEHSEVELGLVVVAVYRDDFAEHVGCLAHAAVVGELAADYGEDVGEFAVGVAFFGALLVEGAGFVHVLLDALGVLVAFSEV
jgi:hypothetical protein